MRDLLRSLRCCLNPRVIGVLVVVAVGVWWLAPGAAPAALPLLVAAVCPLAMGVMAWRMRRGTGCAAGAQASSALDEELSSLRAQVQQERARRRRSARDGTGMSPARGTER